MAIKHATTKTPGQKVFAVADWNADHVVDGNTGEVLFLTAGGNVGTDPNLFWDDTNKRLGIGTATPLKSLHIEGDVVGGELIRLRRTTAGYTMVGAIGMTNDILGKSLYLGYASGGSSFAVLKVYENGDVRIGNPLFFDLSSGFVGIGTTEPAVELEVKGTIYDKTGFVQPVGAITMYGAAAAPTGWLNCNGAAIARVGTYADLFSIIGTNYGIGDGSTTFNVPNFASKFPRGNTAGATGGSDDAIVVTHTHTNSVGNQSASHNHNTVMGSHTHQQTGSAPIYGWGLGGGTAGFTRTGVASGIYTYARNLGTKTSGNQSASHNHVVTIDNAGSSGTNANIPAYLGVNFIIKY